MAASITNLGFWPDVAPSRDTNSTSTIKRSLDRISATTSEILFIACFPVSFAGSALLDMLFPLRKLADVKFWYQISSIHAKYLVHLSPCQATPSQVPLCENKSLGDRSSYMKASR